MSINKRGMDSPDELNNTDVEVLSLLSAGRETRGSLAEQMDKHENYVGERLKWLRVHDLVSYHHEPSALYEITEKGDEWLTATGGVPDE